MSPGAVDEPWYAEGLRFGCTGCGNCCTGQAGSVRLSEAEVRALADHLDLEPHEFRGMYTRTLEDGSLSLRERPNHDCVFLTEERGCRVYAHRPRQCRSWPFWRGVVASARHWAKAKETCPGIDQGVLHDADTIRRTSENDGTSGEVPDL